MSFRRPILLAAAAMAAVYAGPVLAGEQYALPELADNDIPVGDAAYDAGWGEAWDAGATSAWVDAAEPVQIAEAPHGGMAPYGGGYPMPPHAMPPQMMPPQMMAGHGMGLPPQPEGPHFSYSDEERSEWLRECRRRYGDNDDGLGGALIGGVIGGIAGNRIAGEGNRVVGTVAGAAVGAVAGAAIDKGEDSGRARDICENYLAEYEAGYGASYGGAYSGAYAGYGYGYGQNVMWVPMVVGWNCKPKKEVVIEEWIETKPVYKTVPAKYVPVKTKTVPVKTKAVPIKTTKSTKGS